MSVEPDINAVMKRWRIGVKSKMRGIANFAEKARIPPRAKLPIEVKVTACQFGRGTEPRVRSAEPVSRTFLITE